MIKRLFLVALVSGYCLSVAAQKEDYIWYGGQNEYPGTPGNGNYRIRFENGFPEIDSLDLGINFESTVATLCDTIGQLRFISNGCTVYNKFGNELFYSTFEPLNKGEIRDSTCPNIGFIAPRGAMFLPTTPTSFYHAILLHMNMHYDNKWGLVYGPFYFANMNNINVFDANLELLPIKLAPVAQVLRYEPFAVVRKGTGKDWWAVVPEYGKNKYHIIATDIIDAQPLFEQEIGPALKCHIGSSIFSPDGSKYARVHNCGVVVMDFDRCMGVLSNPIYIERPANTFGGGGVAFSDDAKKIIVSSQLAILEADLTQAVPHFDTLIHTEKLWGYSLEYMQQGPDGNLYFSTMQRSKKMPVLKDPFGASPHMEFLDLPVYSSRSLPYFPNYRLYDLAGSPCDTLGINTPVAVHEVKEANTTSLKIWPNPATNSLTISLSEIANLGTMNVRLFNVLGQTLLTQPMYSAQTTLDVSHLPQGLVIVQVYQNGQQIASKRAVIAR